MENLINESVRKFIAEFSENQGTGWYAYVAGDIEAYLKDGVMKSPIEQIFYAAWVYGCADSISSTNLIPQKKIGKYFVDFEVDLISHFVNHDYPFNLNELEQLTKELPKIAIELDGHEFHEKTKEQVEKDKKRERAIVSEGYKVFRFSGREVFRKPLECVFEIRAIIAPVLKSSKLKIWKRNFLGETN